MINWYPGHMAKAKREITESVSKVNIVYLVLDARIPMGSFNDELYEIIKHKPIIYLYNKSSLADLSKLRRNVQENSIIIDALSRRNINKIHSLTTEMLKDHIEKQKEKGYKKVPIRAMVMGIPNVGKSTLINALARSRKASTNKKPGHTRRLDWIPIGDEVYLLDTPGILYPKIEKQETGYHLALTGAIKEEILPKEKLAKYGFKFLNDNYPNYIKDFYNIEERDVYNFFLKLAEYRGYYKAQELDLDQAYTSFLADLREGKIGVIYYEWYAFLWKRVKRKRL